jgi:hypothetical protein
MRVARRGCHIEDSCNKFQFRMVERFWKLPKFFQRVGFDEW